MLKPPNNVVVDKIKGKLHGRIELPTFRLRIECSTTELRQRSVRRPSPRVTTAASVILDGPGRTRNFVVFKTIFMRSVLRHHASVPQRKTSSGRQGGSEQNSRDQSLREKPPHESDECEGRNEGQSGDTMCGNTVGECSEVLQQANASKLERLPKNPHDKGC